MTDDSRPCDCIEQDNRGFWRIDCQCRDEDDLKEAAKWVGYQEALAAADAQGWRPISEAPRDGTEVDLWMPLGDGVRVPDCHWHCGEWLVWGGHPEIGYERVVQGDVEPTHWMPLPPPPDSEPADAQQDTVSVPVEPTEAMVNAGIEAFWGGRETLATKVIAATYRAMVAAAESEGGGDA